MKTKKIIKWVIIFLVLLGCESVDNTERGKYGGNLIFSDSTSPTIIHPFLTFDSISVHIVPLIFNGLLKVTKNGDFIPDLAEHYEIKQNNLEYWVTLKKGIKFHDGQELTSEDVKFTYEKFREIGKEKTADYLDYDFSVMKDIKLIDKYNIRIVLKQKHAPFLYSLSVGILPKHIYQGRDNSNDDVYWHPVGTGPFKLTYIDNTKVVLERFENYFRGRPYLDKITCYVYPSDVIWTKLIREEIDMTGLVSANLLQEVKKVNFLKTYNHLEPAYYMLFLNHKRSFFRDKETRQALNYAVNKDLIIKKVLNGRGIVCSSIFLPNSWAYSKNLKPYKYNPQKALKYLKEAGWTTNKRDGLLYRNGKPFEFECVIVSGYPNIRQSAAFIRKQLYEIGIRMNFNVVQSVQEFYRLKEDNKLDAWFGRLGIIPEPDRNYSYFHSSRIGTSNFLNYKNTEVDQLLERGRRTLDKEKRKKIYYKLQETLFDDPPGIFTFYKHTSIVIHKRFNNAFIDSFNIFREIDKWWIDKNWREQQ